MAQSDHLLLTHSKAYFFALFSLVLLCIGYIAGGQILASVATATLCLSLIALRKADSFNKRWQEQQLLQVCGIAICIITLALTWLDPEGMLLWLLVSPLLLFFIFDFKPAIWLVGGYTLLLSILLGLRQNPIQNVQFAWQYVLLIGISFSLVYLRELRRRQLKPLRRTDNLTTAATREHIDDDLTKEIQRSEREGSDLAVMALAIDPDSLSRLSQKEKATIQVDIGRLLHNNLRLFDSYYLWNNLEFLIVLPHTSSPQATKIANALRVKIRKDIQTNGEQITISVGISGLNVGDDSQSLCERASQALKQTQTRSSNRTHVFRDGTNTDTDSDPEEGRNES